MPLGNYLQIQNIVYSIRLSLDENGDRAYLVAEVGSGCQSRLCINCIYDQIFLVTR